MSGGPRYIVASQPNPWIELGVTFALVVVFLAGLRLWMWWDWRRYTRRPTGNFKAPRPDRCVSYAWNVAMRYQLAEALRDRERKRAPFRRGSTSLCVVDDEVRLVDLVHGNGLFSGTESPR